MAIEIMKNHKEIDIVFFYVGSYFQLPILTARLLKKGVICMVGGVDSKSADANYSNFFVGITKFLMGITFSLTNTIIINSWNLANEKDLIKWKDKMKFGASYFGSEELFRENKPFNQRNDTVGFVGRFSSERGSSSLWKPFP